MSALFMPGLTVTAASCAELTFIKSSLPWLLPVAFWTLEDLACRVSTLWSCRTCNVI